MKIIVTGSLGHIGKPLTKILVAEGHDVIVVTSKDKRKHEIKELGAKAAVGSLSDTGFLIKTFEGADAVHCMIPPSYYHDTTIDPMDFYHEIGMNYLQALKATGVSRITHLSSFGAHLPEGTGMIKGSHHVEQILSELENVQITHLRPASFYYNFLSFIPMIQHTGKIYANYGGADLIQMVSPKDIAVAIAEEITSPTGPELRYVFSDERSGDEVAEVFGRAIGKPGLEWIVISDEQMENSLKESGMASHLAEGLTELYQAFRLGKLSEDFNKHRPEFGSVKLEDYARDFSTVYENKK